MEIHLVYGQSLHGFGATDLLGSEMFMSLQCNLRDVKDIKVSLH